jgi:uncharacterized phage infection (PIP) family protein YhgE
MNRSLLAVGAAALLVLAACNESEPTPDPNVAFCDSLRTLASSVQDFRALGAENTIEEIEAGASSVKDAADAVKEAASSLSDAQVDDIESAADDLRAAVDDISSEATVVEAVQSLVPQLLALRTSINDVGELKCGAVLLEAEASAAVEQVEAEASAITEAAASLKAEIEAAGPDAEASPAG